MERFQIPVCPFNAPLSGDVNQTFNPWTWTFAPQNSSFSLFSIDLGPSENPEVEADVLRNVASYGRQIGRMQEVVSILLDRLEETEKLQGAERAAVEDFRTLMRDIAKVKATGRSRRSR